jgi:tRNA(adenine34) deaminase
VSDGPYDYGMRLALDQAHNALLVGEVPVGAVILRHTDSGPQVVATGYNRPITTHDPTAHAEMIALTSATNYLDSKWLNEAAIYVTIEPCSMCAGALVLAGLILNHLVAPAWILLTWFAGAGLVFAGVSGFCGMALLLRLLPWNQVKKR